MAIGSFAEIETILVEPMNPIEERMCELLERKITAERPTIVGFTIPFPGCLLAALRWQRNTSSNIIPASGRCWEAGHLSIGLPDE